jgi:transcriptional regulator with XRE-family HTH domain
MGEGVNGIHGEYRRFTATEVGGVIRMFRQLQGLKRVVLAAEANVSEKTIERAEAGEGISEDSCRRIARALGMKENAFTDELYIPTPEEAERLQKQKDEELRRTHRAVPVASIESPRDILPLFDCYGLFGDDQHVADVHLRDFAELKQMLVDYGDISADLTATQRLEGAEEVLKAVRDFETHGYLVKCGVAKDYHVRGDSWPCSIVVAFKKPVGNVRAPDEIWLPKTMRFGL